jgi:predicted RNA-binding Zn-ribbon protein involved in translation (DUF1610 family)
MSLTFVVDEICPKCRKPVRLAVIERHPDRRDLAVHNYQCANCGPVRARIIPLTPQAA